MSQDPAIELSARALAAQPPLVLRRLPDWPRRLNAYIRERRCMPYAYGTNDCCCFALDGAVLALTGTTLLENVKRPMSWLGAARFMLAGGWDDVRALATARLGAPLPAPRLAQRGDIVSFVDRDEHHLGVCIGMTAATPQEHGLVFVPMSLWRTAWKVG